MKYCTHCKKKKKKSAFHKNRTRKDGLCYWCKKCAKKYREKYKEYLHGLQKKQRRLLKSEVMVHYGNRCKCCGEKEFDFLTIDHINNDGVKHRKQLKKEGGSNNFYLWLKRNNYPKGFQILCFNCNCGKRINDGICPHRSGHCLRQSGKAILR